MKLLLLLVIMASVKQTVGISSLITYAKSQEQIDTICTPNQFTLCHFWWRTNPEQFWEMNYKAKQDYLPSSSSDGVVIEKRVINAWRSVSKVTSKDEYKTPLPTLPSQLTETCSKLPLEYLGNFSSYVLRETKQGSCYLPSSRSYLLSYYSSAIEANHDDVSLLYSGKLKPGMVAKLRFHMCKSLTKFDELPWRDIWTRTHDFNKETSRDDYIYEICDQLNMWGRLRKMDEKASFENEGIDGVSAIYNIDIKYLGKCQWESSFIIPDTRHSISVESDDIFQLDILNTWINGGYGAGLEDDTSNLPFSMNKLHCDVTPGFAWRGQSIETLWEATYFAPDVMANDVGFMDCCDRCMMHEHCQSWTHWQGTGQQNCWFFNRLPPSNPPPFINKHTSTDSRTIEDYDVENPLLHEKEYSKPEYSTEHSEKIPLLKEALMELFGNNNVYSGLRRKGQPLVFELGGRSGGVVNQTCIEQGHILGSPFKVSVMKEHELQFIKDFYDKTLKSKTTAGSSIMLSSSINSEHDGYLGDEEVCGRDIVGSMQGHWSQFDHTEMCHVDLPSTDTSVAEKQYQTLLLERPICHLSGGPFGSMVWQLDKGKASNQCRIHHYTTNQAKQCISTRNITNIVFSGDSVVGLLSQAVKAMLGSKRASTGESWYSASENKEKDGGSRAFASDEVQGSRGHVLEFGSAALRSSLLDIDPRAAGRQFIDSLNLPRHRGGTTVVIVNFGIHHLLWHHGLKWIEKAVRGFMEGLYERMGSLSHEITSVGTVNVGGSIPSSPPTVDIILLTPSAIHGFREPYITQDRSREISKILKSIFLDYQLNKTSYLRILDANQLEITRPEMTADGLHYNGMMNYMTTQLLFNMVCNE